MEEITAVVQGETDKVVVSLKTADINKIKIPRDKSVGLGVSIGRILDADEAKNFTAEEIEALQDNKAALGGLIATYISTLTSYSLMTMLGLKTIVITSLRSNKGYVTRVAGILPQQYDKVTCTFDGDFIPAHEGLLIGALSTCPHYTKQYEASSIFHKLKSEASAKGPRIEITESR
jgi:hypothetical protein